VAKDPHVSADEFAALFRELSSWRRRDSNDVDPFSTPPCGKAINIFGSSSDLIPFGRCGRRPGGV
jgi:hypothetical protein